MKCAITIIFVVYFYVKLIFTFMQTTMLFSSTKTGHIGQILSTAFFGQIVTSSLAPPDPGQIEMYGHLVIQVLVAVVTIWATVRKALQKPEAVVKVPATAVAVAVPGPPATTTPSIPADASAAE